MPTILFLFGFRFIIYTRDHNPPHIHAIKGDMATKIGIYPNIYLMENRELSQKDLKTVMNVAEEYQERVFSKMERISRRFLLISSISFELFNFQINNHYGQKNKF